MAAGGSAAEQAGQARRRALDLEEKATRARAEAGRYEFAAQTEHRIVSQLGRLASEGYCVLTDRRWPGSQRANVDCVVVGPGGVFIVDPKGWADVEVVPGRMVRAGVDVTGELANLSALAETTRAALAEVGLAPREVHVLVALAGWGDLCATVGGVDVVGERSLLARIVGRGQRLSSEQVDEVLAGCMRLFPAMPKARAGRAVSSEQPPTAQVPTQPVPAQQVQRRADGAPQLDLLSDRELAESVLEGKLGRPIEDWMSFLHPHQARLVRGSSSGPARIRGAAGTGKTVVGLHRAAWLAQTRPGRILVTGYVRTLPVVLRELYSRLSPETVERVDFISVHSLAIQELQRAGARPAIANDGGRLEFDRAWSRVEAARGPLGRSALDREYWQEEVEFVIKGRALMSFADYASLRRVGRRYKISPDQRRAVWELYREYQQCLAERGLLDFHDVLTRAEQLVRRRCQPPRYASVIVDEVQDLTCVGMRLLHGLVGDAPDGLLLIGDGQQAIYPGGFTLAEVGIDVRGRSTVLRRNYRNTKEILRVAQQVVAADAFEDLDDSDELGQRDVVATRSGKQPIFVVEATGHRLDVALLREIERVRALPGVRLGDIAVLASGNAQVTRYAALLARHEIPAMNLVDYTGRTNDRVKVGTYFRAKGLDFKYVLLPRWELLQVDPGREQSDTARRERLERDRRTLFVAMTRARDGLWLGSLRRSGPAVKA